MEYQDWIEQEAEEQRREILRNKMDRFVPVEDGETNMVFEQCCECDALTGRVGPGEDSLFCDQCDVGPLCEGCFEEHSYHEEDLGLDGVLEQ